MAMKVQILDEEGDVFAFPDPSEFVAAIQEGFSATSGEIAKELMRLTDQVGRLADAVQNLRRS